jgi:hypothetical protein
LSGKLTHETNSTIVPKVKIDTRTQNQRDYERRKEHGRAGKVIQATSRKVEPHLSNKWRQHHYENWRNRRIRDRAFKLRHVSEDCLVGISALREELDNGAMSSALYSPCVLAPWFKRRWAIVIQRERQ